MSIYHFAVAQANRHGSTFTLFIAPGVELDVEPGVSPGGVEEQAHCLITGLRRRGAISLLSTLAKTEETRMLAENNLTKLYAANPSAQRDDAITCERQTLYEASQQLAFLRLAVSPMFVENGVLS